MTDVNRALAPAVVAVLGTLLGSALTFVFQRISGDRAERLARSRQLRADQMSAYSNFGCARGIPAWSVHVWETAEGG